MPNVQVYNYFSVIIDGEKIEGGSLERPVNISVAGEVHQQVFSVEVSSSQEIWDSRDGTIGNFDFLFIQADRDVVLQLTVDVGGQVGKVNSTITVKGTGTANKYGPALVLGADDAYASDYTEDFAAGTLDVIDRLVVKNNDSTNAAKVKITAIT